MSSAPLDFFNSLTGRLEIELSEPRTSPTGSVAELAPRSASITAMELKPEIFEHEMESFGDLTQEELGRVALDERWVVLRGQTEMAVRHRAPNGQFFTVADLLTAVEETERQTRDQSDWFGGLDVHHVFFEGIRLTRRFPRREWTINWGS